MSIEREAVEKQLERLGTFNWFLARKELRHLPDILADGETLHAITSGFYESKSWIVVVTDLRILFLDCGMFFGIHQIDLPLAQISAVSQKVALFYGELEVATSAGRRTIARVPRKHIGKLSSIIATMVHGETAHAASDAPPAAAATSELGTQLEKLAALWQQGALNDAEFERAKTRLIGS